MAEPRKRRGTGRVTLADVAKLAGVGSMTVSRALRTPDQVSDKLRDKIQQVVDELGYIPNKAAGALASGQSYSIAVILPSLAEKACTSFIPSFQQVLNQAGYQLVLGYSNYSMEQEEDLLSTLLASSPAAVVLFGSERSVKSKNILENAKLPVLEVAELNPLAIDMNIGVDHYEAGKAMTRHLIGQGYKNIGFVGAHGEQAILRKQLRGWQAGMIEGYLTPDHFLTTHESPSINLGCEGVAKLLLRQRDLDALICSHEEIAMGALFECQRRVLPVPKGLAVACLDGSQFSEQCYPRLTAIHIDYPKMGEEAARKLLNTLDDNNESNIKQLNIGFTLQERASS
ncbi:LacI family DNA-binding transcriptional regulator [Photobacterium profundum]|uniref:Putative transcriptional regulator n=1 Tax=Photobacterium profundum 3TCK TaxID=314280 RepID=Q1ZA75_9GAMM|nr:LacI family DNA-binding transcriptional regulator [Photobacterium profundum]EAS45617.1 putative transcriptional regulator [Photobacterium profundum 3TCK]PSV63220.1 LacI family DNA-binding transcriptional regulator [Photobacterium profundum]